MGDQLMIHDDLKLRTTQDKFYLEPSINPTEVLVIDRITGTSSVVDYKNAKIPGPENAYQPVCGFLGSIQLISGLYLVVAKYRKLIGKINGHDIYELAGTTIIPYSRSDIHLTSKQIEDNAEYEELLRKALQTPGMYFSYGHDLTHSFQRLHSAPADFQKMSMVARADPTFLWNSYLLKDYSDIRFARFALPIIQGFVAIHNLMINNNMLSWAVVSRRSNQRAGTRFFMRGIDAQGSVANFVETEQIIERGPDKASFVQTRGSIPLYWTQYPDLRYKPPIVLVQEDHVSAYVKHIRDQHQRYGNQVLISLIDQGGKEEAVGAGYQAAVFAAALPGVRYEPFDFHTECRGMRYDRLQILMDRIQHEQKEFSFFMSMGPRSVRQSGVFRTNCVDCLDRTNVVQSMLARNNLRDALHALRVVAHDDPLVEFDGIFNNVWADHADVISTQYSGTPALKTDYTRTGKRTRAGLMRDGINSLTRYYLNNFSDGSRQDGIDLICGRHRVRPDEGNTTACPLKIYRPWRYYALPSLLVVALGLFCHRAISAPKYDTTELMWLLLCSTVVGATFTFIMKHGTEWVDWPRLDGGGLATTRAIARSSSL